MPHTHRFSFGSGCALAALLTVLGACDPGVSLGTSCERSSQCSAPLVCGAGRCRTECIVHRDCPLGATCLLIEGGSVCSLEEDGCESSADCAAPLRCVASQCRQTCGGDDDCVADGVCLAISGAADRVCVDPRTEPDAGVPGDSGAQGDSGAEGDSGAPDAGTCESCVVDLALAPRTTCAVTASGAVWCWGSDGNGLLADGATAHADGCSEPCSLAPVRVLTASGPLEGARTIGCGEGHCCVLTDASEVWCWGRQYAGQLGDRTATGAFAAPVVRDFEPLAGVRELAVGWNHSCAILDGSGEMVCWGENVHGELGDGTVLGPDTLRTVTVLAGARAMSLDFQLTCAVGADDGVSCWGLNQRGTMGATALGGETLAAVAIEGTTGATQIATGDYHACAIVDGAVRCWGDGRGGQLGVDPRPLDCAPDVEPECSFVARDVTTLPPGAIAVGSAPTSLSQCAVLADGRAFCWGRNDSSQVGVMRGGGPELQPVPVRDLDGTTLLRGARAIAIGNHACVILENGELRCWGANDQGQLGLGTFDLDVDHAVPRTVVLPR